MVSMLSGKLLAARRLTKSPILWFIILALSLSSLGAILAFGDNGTDSPGTEDSQEEISNNSAKSQGDDNGGLDWRYLVGTGIVGSILGYVFKFLSNVWTARRQMIESITKDVEGRARNYYWLLANDSSVLRTLLDTYLRKREEVQLQFHNDREEMKQKLSKVKEEIADDALYFYGKLMKTIYNFQWVAGDTYFLRDYWSGKSLTQLYNRLTTVMEGIDANVVIDAIGSDMTTQNTNDDAGHDDEGKTSIDSRISFFSKLEDEKEPVKEVFGKFKEWFDRTDLVWDASHCLKAYSDLFNYELAILYKDWFRKGWFRKRIKMEPTEYELGRTFLDTEAKEAILRLSPEPLTLRPIGIHLPSRETPRGGEAEGRRDRENGKDGKTEDGGSKAGEGSAQPPKPPAEELTEEDIRLYHDIYLKLEETKIDFESFIEQMIRRSLTESEKKKAKEISKQD